MKTIRYRWSLRNSEDKYNKKESIFRENELLVEIGRNLKNKPYIRVWWADIPVDPDIQGDIKNKNEASDEELLKKAKEIIDDWDSPNSAYNNNYITLVYYKFFEDNKDSRENVEYGRTEFPTTLP
jgi:hypothetical protein